MACYERYFSDCKNFTQQLIPAQFFNLAKWKAISCVKSKDHFKFFIFYGVMTPLLPGGFTCKSHIFAPLSQLCNSPVNCSGEVFKPSKDLASLLVCNEKKFCVLGFSWVMS